MGLTKAETEARCGFTIEDEIWRFRPWGNRILIRRESPEQYFGKIVIPESAQKQISAGTVIKVGDGVGSLNGLPGQALIPMEFYTDGEVAIADPNPDALVGHVVTFGHWSGEAIRPDKKHTITGDTYDTEYLLIQAIDIWGDNSKE